VFSKRITHQVLQQYPMPRFWGHGRTEPHVAVEVFYPIPINVVVMWWDKLQFKLKRPNVMPSPAAIVALELAKEQRAIAEALATEAIQIAQTEDQHLASWRQGYQAAHDDMGIEIPHGR
jgi:hypothetical protein